MSIKESIKIAIFSIRTNLMRSLLTMLGIIIGVSSVIAIITVGDGGRDYIISMLEDMNSTTASITVSQTASPSEYITREDLKAIKALPTIEYASPATISMGTASSELVNKCIAMTLSGTEDLRQVADYEIMYGRFYTKEEYESGAKVCLMVPTSAEQLFGYVNCVGKYFEFTLNDQTVRLKIIGIVNTDYISSSSSSSSSMSDMFSTGEASALFTLPQTVIDAMMGSAGYYNMVYISAYDVAELDTAVHSAANLLYTRHGNFGTEVYTVTNMATFVDLLDKIISILTKFIAGVSGISLLVGGIGVMNIMLVSVTERTREIGIRKSLGARTSTILGQFLTESIILCLIGGILGFITGVGGAILISMYINIPIKIELSTIVISVGFSSAIGIFFGIYPARKAAKMPPIEALRRE